MLPLERQIRAWVRDEQAKIDAERQEACDHKTSGTLNDGVLTCDTCGKVLVFDPNANERGPGPSEHDKRHFETLRKDK